MDQKLYGAFKAEGRRFLTKGCDKVDESLLYASPKIPEA